MTELELHQPTNPLAEQMKYAQAVSTASLLPQAYRGKPADIMIAMGLGSAMGLNEAEALYRIDVIQGKPTASAELIASNVRKAGHRLRTVVDEANLTATTSIWRADDPEFEHRVTRDMAWAKRMGLDTKDNYKKQPATMLANRSITGAARLACPEALYGVAYTSDEMYDLPGVQSSGLASVLNQTSEPDPVAATTAEPSASGSGDDGESSGSEPDVPMVSKAQLTKIGACMGDLGIKERAEALGYVSATIGRQVESRNELTRSEAKTLIDRLEEDIATSGAEEAEVVA